MSKINRRNYDAFSWIPLGDWNVDRLMGPRRENTIYCKICDEYVKVVDSEGHIDRHITQRKRQLSEDRRKAKELRLELLQRAREEKAIQNAGKL